MDELLLVLLDVAEDKRGAVERARKMVAKLGLVRPEG
jgi:hypothetical protein